VGSAVGKPTHKPETDFYDPFSLYVSDLYGGDPETLASAAQIPHLSSSWVKGTVESLPLWRILFYFREIFSKQFPSF